MNNRKVRSFNGLSFLALIVLVFAIFWFTNQVDERAKQINRTEFEQILEDEDYAKIIIALSKDVPTGEVIVQLKDETEKYLSVSDVKDIEKILRDKKIEYDVKAVPKDSILLTTVFPVALIAGGMLLLFLMLNRQGGGGNAKAMNFGKSKAKLSTDKDKKVTFANVAGLDEEKEDLAEVVEFLKHPQKFIDVGARIPKGMLL